jgi:hypothetical protein
VNTATAVLGLEKAGFTREQVEALAAYTETQVDLGQLVTKAELRAELLALERRLTLRLGGIVVVAVAVVAALVKLL